MNLPLALLTGLLAISCQSHPTALLGDAPPSAASASAAPPGPSEDDSIESICHMRAGAAVKYAAQNREREDLPGAPRLTVRVSVPPGLSQEELTANLCHAAVTFFSSAGAKLGGITVLAYRDTSTKGAFTAGKVVFAPDGKWERADPSVPLGAWKMNSEIVSAYLVGEAPINAGTAVTLTDGDGTTVTISRVPERWGDAERVGTVPNGTRARVLARKEFSMGTSTMVRYEIETIGGGPKRHGWIHAYAAHAVASAP